jgi:hypothetical protein
VIFLIEYDRERGLLVSIGQFPDSQRPEAELARLNLELSLNQGRDREIVLLEAASEEAVRKTHRRYFERIEDLASIPKSNGN